MKYYLVYWYNDELDRESCSVFYCELVMANSPEQALDIYFENNKEEEDTEERRGLYRVIEKRLYKK
jgi:hypothetical protein